VSAGLPGLGLGGLFFVLSALLAPFVELIRTTRGRSSLAAWRAVGRQFALALTMIAAIELTLRLLYALADATGLAGPLSDRSPTVLALRPIGITLGLLAGVLAAAKAMQLIATIRTRGRPPVPALRALCSRPRLLGRLGALTAVCLTLMLVGPSELTHTPAGGKAAATMRAPGPVTRTPSEASGIKAGVERGSAFSGTTGQPVGMEDSAARQAGSDSPQRAAVGGGDGEEPAPPPSGRGGRGGSRTPQPSPPAAAPPPARALPEVGSGQTPGRPLMPRRPETPREPETPGRPQAPPGSGPAVGFGGASDNAAAESGQTRGSGRGWGRTGTPAPSHDEAGTAVE
jgi:hypothetical protein